MSPHVVLPPGWLGCLGGGQLGRMFVHAAQRLGYRVIVLDPDPSSPAGRAADRHLCADYTDADALAELAATAAAITTEFENVPAEALEMLALQPSVQRVAPTAGSVLVAQHRLREKAFLLSAGIDVAPYVALPPSNGEIAISVDWQACSACLPGILKTARFGYDGKGQAVVNTLAELQQQWQSWGRPEAILEKKLSLVAECSLIAARGADGDVCMLPAVENVHHQGILALSVMPARLAEPLLAQARAAMLAVLHALDYQGVLCIEFFIVRDADGSLRCVANEMAPRPHNSGHASIEACMVSQFALQVRTLAGLPLPASSPPRAVAMMLNLLGDVWFDDEDHPIQPDWAALLRLPGVYLHLYGKDQAKRGRKMGHVTILADDHDQAMAMVQRVKGILPQVAVDRVGLFG